MGWTTFAPGIHWPFVDVVPDDDLVVHEFGDDCVCGPSVEFEGLAVPMYTHHSLDGREQRE